MSTRTRVQPQSTGRYSEFEKYIGLDEGDRFSIENPDGEQVTVKVTKVTDEKSVLQRVGSGFSHYGKHSVAELARHA